MVDQTKPASTTSPPTPPPDAVRTQGTPAGRPITRAEFDQLASRVRTLESKLGMP